MNTEATFQEFTQLNIMVVGDVMIDRYLSGYVSRVSPEAPVPVVHLDKSDNRLGGAANVALNIHAMGANAILCSVTGEDENAHIFAQLLPENGLSEKGILQSSERTTTVKTRVIAQNQHLLRVDREDTFDLTEKEQQGLLNKIRAIIEKEEIHLILFQDYNKGVLSDQVIQAVLELAKQHGIRTAVDPKKKNFWAFKGVDLFKPNLKEIQESCPFPIEANLESLKKAASFVREQLQNRITLITLSEKGLFIDIDGNSHLIPTEVRSIADVCGAGDTVISLAALGLAAGMEVREIAFLANLAGGQVCEKVGVVPVDKAQLKEEYKILRQARG